MHGLEERRTPGNTLIVQPDKPYQVLHLQLRDLLLMLLCMQSLNHPAADMMTSGLSTPSVTAAFCAISAKSMKRIPFSCLHQG